MGTKLESDEWEVTPKNVDRRGYRDGVVHIRHRMPEGTVTDTGSFVYDTECPMVPLQI
jgi:hypothetical protein